MASKTPENAVVDPNTIVINKKIVELKKKILLAEGQKKSYIGEWTQREKQNKDTILELKKEIKELTGKLTHLNNIGSRKYTKDPQEVIRKIAYPTGAKSAEDALRIYDLKIIDLTKQLDLLNNKYSKRKQYFNTILEKYHESKPDNGAVVEPPTKTSGKVEHAAATVEEDESRKLICHLENEIHRTNVQWMEAEHIRKKYKSIKASLMTDSEKFEKSLLELEEAIAEQQTDINRMQAINNEALQIRDTTKVGLVRQEHAAHSSTRSRERQAFDFRRQVEERKLELDRLERKLFSTGKAMVHQGSIESLTGDRQTGKLQKQDSNDLAQETTCEMETEFKNLMEATAATSPPDVLERFLAQKESTSRLNYLRTVTEGEKKHLENQREVLISQLESFKFSDVKENEINQEQVEKLKNDIAVEQQREEECLQAAEHSNIVIESIKSTLLDLILKLQVVDEAVDAQQQQSNNTSEQMMANEEEDIFQMSDLVTGNISNYVLLQVLEDKLRKGLILSGQLIADNKDTTGMSDEEIADIKANELHLNVPIPSISPSTSPTPRPVSALDDREKPQPYPSCYTNLMAGRIATTGQISSASPNQISQPVATDDEGDVPSRGYLKKQAQYIVDSKSRRKGFRVAARR